METHISGACADKVIQRLRFYHSFRIEVHGFSGGIWIVWNDDVEVIVQHVSNQFIHGCFHLKGSSHWLALIIVYASLNVMKRFSQLFSNFMFDNGLLEAYYRVLILHGSKVHSLKGLTVACSMILDLTGFLVLWWFTWIRYLASWQDHPQFVELVNDLWDCSHGVDINLSNLWAKLEAWNLDSYGHIGHRKHQLLARIKGIDHALQVGHSDFLVNVDHELRAKLEDLISHDECLWFQTQ
ncbi:hypothetical protein V6N12_016823 [Hibiscus sabdariffa]|uniref:Uncharacterized protein n=1 Tax=Hibiscus sabdariffa TaxID=183260 RepID=A0ABR2BP97_9ROSI